MFAGRTDTTLPVTGADGRNLGTLNAHDVLDALAAADPATVIALTADTAPVAVTGSVGDVLRAYEAGITAVPVASASGELVGWVRERDVLTAMSVPPT